MDDFPPFIRTMPDIDVPFEHVTGHLMQGEQQQVAFLRFHEDTVVPEHTHRAQWELVIEGEVALTAWGKETTFRAGDTFYLEEGEPHSALVKAGYRAVVFFDQTDRYGTK